MKKATLYIFSVIIFLTMGIFSCTSRKTENLPSPLINDDEIISTSVNTPTSRPYIITDIITPTPIITSTPKELKSATIISNLSDTPSLSLTSTPKNSFILPGFLASISMNSFPPQNVLIQLDILDIVHLHNTSLPQGQLFSGPSWSPDGHWIAYSMDVENEPYIDIYIISIDGNEWKRITYGIYDHYNITWSPDGKKIAFITPKLHILSLDTGNSSQIADIQVAGTPIWSMDGQQIFFRGISQDGGYYLYSIDINGKNLTKLTDFQIGSGNISNSPDGKLIAYRSADGCGDICVFDLQNRMNTCLTQTKEGETDPTWSPDGNYIAFLGTTDSYYCLNQISGESMAAGWKIFMMKSDGSDRVRLIDNNMSFDQLLWSPVPSVGVGKKYSVTEAGDHLNVRQSPSLNAQVMTTLLSGDNVSILQGPVDNDNYYWWKLLTKDGIEGWAVEVYGWFQPITP